MLKLVGSALILSGGLLARFRQMSERRRTVEALSDLTAALGRMAEEIRMARTPLPALLESLADSCGADAEGFFRTAAESARRGEALPAAWRRAALALPLSGADAAALASLGEGLHGDEEGICKEISRAAYQLAKSLEEAARRQPEEDKRSTALWLSGAALLVILLV